MGWQAIYIKGSPFHNLTLMTKHLIPVFSFASTYAAG